jgi:hypothetical protein
VGRERRLVQPHVLEVTVSWKPSNRRLPPPSTTGAIEIDSSST